MAKKRPRPRTPKRRPLLLPALLIIGALLLLLFAEASFWRVFMKPSLKLAVTEATAELGKEPNLLSFVSEIRHADTASLVTERSGAPEGTPGDAVITYSVAQSEGFSKFISLFPKRWRPFLITFLWTDSEKLTLHVVDTIPPTLTLKEGVYQAVAGDIVYTKDFVEQADDLDGAEVHFSDGSDIFVFTKSGDVTVSLVAKDPSGNRTYADASAYVQPPDETAPVISGTEDVLIACGTPFDVLAGVTVSDDRDSAPALTASPASIGTDYPGSYTILYTAVDGDGNQSSALRNVTVAEHVLTWNGKGYIIHWDTAGIAGQPYFVAVNRVHNTVTVYEQDDEGRYTIPVKAMLCSVGDSTPAGYYRTEERHRWKELFGDCYGQYAIRITGHILFHSVPYWEPDPSTLEYEEFNLLGTSASMGCVRLSTADEKWLYDNCPEGFRCCIYDEETSPGPLGKPEAVIIDTSDARRGWDPTDPDENNPWHY